MERTNLVLNEASSSEPRGLFLEFFRLVNIPFIRWAIPGFFLFILAFLHNNAAKKDFFSDGVI